MKKGFNLGGTVTFSAIGAYNEEFLSELIESGVKVKNLHNKDNIIYAEIKRSDYLFVSKIAKKYRVRTRILKREGIYFKIRKMNRYSGIVAGIIISVALVMFLGQRVWKIDIKGSENVSDSLILEIIDNNGITLGSDIGSIDTDELALKIKHTLKNVAWVGVEKIGSKLTVSVGESESQKKAEIPLKTPCNVIADKTGVIVETEVYSGKLLYPIGSGVSKGNIIVSGIVNDGADNILLSHANAKIMAEFRETVEIRQDYTTVEQKKCGDYITEKEIMFLGFVFPISHKIIKPNNCICEEQIENITFMNITLPIKIKTNKYLPYEEIVVTRKMEDAEKLVEQKLDIYCKNFFDEYEIIDISRNIKHDEKGITMIADVLLKGNIAVQQEIMEKNKYIIDS